MERGREMYSAELYKEDFLAMRKLLKDQDDKLIKALTRCNQIFLEYKRECDTCMVCEDDISLFIFALMRLAERLDLFLRKQREHPKKKEILEFYLNLRNFLNIYESCLLYTSGTYALSAGI